MPSSELLISFFLATLIFAYMPGPAMLYTSAQTIARGRSSGWMAVLGIHLGGYFHVVVAASGLATLFTTVPVLFTILKFVGSAYLCWLGLKFIFKRDNLLLDDLQIDLLSPQQAFRDSIIVEILNPKTAVFYLAFLPQFTSLSVEFPIWGQLLILGTIVNVLFSSADVMCVVIADRLTRWLKGSTTANRVVQNIGGSILIMLGINLVTQKQ